jgi:phage-related minor tail protein
MPEHEVTHGDILHKLGVMEGKLDAVHQSLAQKHTDIADAFRRLTEVEKRVAQGVILAVILSLVVPFVVSAASPRLHFGSEPSVEALPK